MQAADARAKIALLAAMPRPARAMEQSAEGRLNLVLPCVLSRGGARAVAKQVNLLDAVTFVVGPFRTEFILVLDQEHL